MSLHRATMNKETYWVLVALKFDGEGDNERKKDLKRFFKQTIFLKHVE